MMTGDNDEEKVIFLSIVFVRFDLRWMD